MFYNFFGFYIQNCCEKNPKNTRGRCRCSKLTSPTVCNKVNAKNRRNEKKRFEKMLMESTLFLTDERHLFYHT